MERDLTNMNMPVDMDVVYRRYGIGVGVGVAAVPQAVELRPVEVPGMSLAELDQRNTFPQYYAESA